MTAFLGTQLDFILFFYGLAFVLLGTTCIAIARVGGRNEAWVVLGLFGFVHGASEWLDLAAMVVSDQPAFALLRLVVMTASFVLLMEFARREAIRLGWKAPGPWAYAPPLALLAVVAALGGIDAAGALARYIFGFVGAAAVALVFARLARAFSGFTRRLALCAAAGFAAYAVAAGAIVPAANVWPATVINHDWFLALTGVPIQLVRGMLACWLAFSLWSIWGQSLVTNVSSARYTRFMRRQFVLTLVAMATILVGGWTLTELLGDIYQENVQQEASGDIDLLAGRLREETAAVDAMVKVLAGSPSVRPLLEAAGARDDSAAQAAQSVLDLHITAAAAARGTILDRNESVVISSGGQDSSDSGPAAPNAESMSDRAALDFARAIAGEPGAHFVFDPRSRAVAYVASHPIRNRGGGVIGVAVLNKGLGAFAADLARFDHPYFLVDADGVVMQTNRPDMLLRPLWPLNAARRAQHATAHGPLTDRPAAQHEIADATWIGFAGARGFARRRAVGHGDWSLVMLEPTKEIYASRVLGIVITLLVAMMMLVYLFGKERWFHDSVQLEKRLELQNLAQDLRFQATTDPLTGLFNRLKFDQALSIEMSRAGRHGTPMCLVLYDVDHFKKVNDTHGHQVGDQVLSQLSRLVASHIRDCDVLARWGGEEFVIMLPGCETALALAAAERLRLDVYRTAFDVVGSVTCSFGVAAYADGDTAATLIARADDALYRAKVNGRNRVELADRPAKVDPELPSVA